MKQQQQATNSSVGLHKWRLEVERGGSTSPVQGWRGLELPGKVRNLMKTGEWLSWN